MLFSTILLSTGLAQLGLAAYNLKDDYSANNFANMFRFDTEDDPTHGYVNYVDKNTALQDNLYKVDNGHVLLGVDDSHVASGRGRNSVRLTSNAAYTHGLIILDLDHMPGNACGSWPAFWMTGPNWPNSGEIDIIEGVNTQSGNQMTMHTSAGCTLVNKNCQGNLGCAATGGGARSFGTGFNQGGGGIFATEWTSNHINIWFFPRGTAPGDIHSANPNPGNWGNPTSSFVGGSGCNIDSHFMNNNIVFDTAFCGDWAGSVWSQDPTCSKLAPSCQAYVQNNPRAFQEVYWKINSLKVYQQAGARDLSSSQAESTTQSTLSESTVETASNSPSNVTVAPVSSGKPVNSANVTLVQSTGGASPIVPTPVSPSEAPVAVVTQTVTGDFVVTHTHYPSVRHGHNGAILPEKRMISHRAARHLQQHAHGAHRF